MGFRTTPVVESRMPTIALIVLAAIISLHIFMLLSDSHTPLQTVSIHDSARSFAPSLPLDSPVTASAAPPTFSAPPRYTPFPRKIWQTAKSGPAGLDDIDRTALRTWSKLNQKWRYEAVTQYGAESYVRERFVHRPDLVEAFTDLQDPILRADFVRYLVLLGDGGVYSDLDTRALKPIDDWVPAEHRRAASVVVGVEYDKLEGGRWADWTLDLQFATWAILAKPGHPLLELTVQKVIDGLHRLAIKQDTTVAGVRPSFQEVLDTTGPALFTNAVFEQLSEATATNFTWMNVTDLKAPRLVDDILILPITAFGCGQQHSNSGSPEDDVALVQHLFKGSWKGDHPLFAAPQEEKHEEEKQRAEKHEEEKHEEAKPKEEKHEEEKHEAEKQTEEKHDEHHEDKPSENQEAKGEAENDGQREAHGGDQEASQVESVAEQQGGEHHNGNTNVDEGQHHEDWMAGQMQS